MPARFATSARPKKEQPDISCGTGSPEATASSSTPTAQRIPSSWKRARQSRHYSSISANAVGPYALTLNWCRRRSSTFPLDRLVAPMTRMSSRWRRPARRRSCSRAMPLSATISVSFCREWASKRETASRSRSTNRRTPRQRTGDGSSSRGISANPAIELRWTPKSGYLVRAKPTPSGRVTRRASSDPACFAGKGTGSLPCVSFPSERTHGNDARWPLCCLRPAAYRNPTIPGTLENGGAKIDHRSAVRVA